MTQLSPLRHGMIEDMTVRNLWPATQPSYIHAVAKFTLFLPFAGFVNRHSEEKSIYAQFRICVNDDRLGSALIQGLAQFGAIVSLVAKHAFRRLHSADQALGDRAVVRFTSGQQDGDKAGDYATLNANHPCDGTKWAAVTVSDCATQDVVLLLAMA